MLKMDLQQFAQDRILGSQVTIAFYGSAGPVNFMEVDKFTPNRKSSQKQWQPLGQVGQRTQDIYEDWELDFEGGIVDPTYDDIVDQIDQAAQNGQKNVRYRVTETTIYYDGSSKTWVYPDAVLYDFKKDIASAKDEIKWSFKGSAQTRTAG